MGRGAASSVAVCSGVAGASSVAWRRPRRRAGAAAASVGSGAFACVESFVRADSSAGTSSGVDARGVLGII